MSVEALMRDGPRGDGKFIPIGMDEALRTATMWLSMLGHDAPDELTICVGKHNDYGLASDWADKFGTKNLLSDRVLSAANAPAFRCKNKTTTLVLAIGSGTGHGALGTQQQLALMRKNGVKIISVNPVKTGLSVLADQWICITPGKDEALLQVLCQIVHDKRVDYALLDGSGVSKAVVDDLAGRLKTHNGSLTILAGRGVFAHRHGCFTTELIEQLRADVLASADQTGLPGTLGNLFGKKCEAILALGSHLPWKLHANETLLGDFRSRFDGHIIALSDTPPGFDTCADLVFCGSAEENLIELAARLGLKDFSKVDGTSPYKNGYSDYVGKRHELAPANRRASVRQMPDDPHILDASEVWGLSDHFPFWAISQKAGADRNRALVFMHSARAKELGLNPKDRVVVSSSSGSIGAVLAIMDDMDPNTVWSWGASLFGKIADSTAIDASTGQPAWFDLRVQVEKAP